MELMRKDGFLHKLGDNPLDEQNLNQTTFNRF